MPSRFDIASGRPSCPTLRLAVLVRVTMSAVLVFSLSGAALVIGMFGVQPAEAASMPKRISALAYEMKSDGKDTWDVKAGEQDTISVRGGQLRICIIGEWAGGVEISQADEQDWSDKGAPKNFLYDWDNKGTNDEALEVSSTGVVTAKRDGTTKITVTVASDKLASDDKGAADGPSCTIKIRTANQDEGLMATELEIVNEAGRAYGDDNIVFGKLNAEVKLYVRVTFVDKGDRNRKVVYGNYPKAPAGEKPPSGAFDTLDWKVGDDQYVRVTNHSGVGWLKSIANALTTVRATITGGDATKDHGEGPGVVFDTVGVKVNNGKQVDGQNPADTLKVNVVYEKAPEKILKSETFTVAQFEKLGAVTRTYTMTQSAGKYVTDKARGVPIATLLGHLRISTNDVSHFTLAANDGANPGKITAKWLLKTTRYYLPNYDLGGSLQEKEQVPSMLAVEDSWASNTMEVGQLNSGTRFRLVFGAASRADGATDKSIKFINTFTVVLAGAPAAQENKNPTNKGENGGGGGGAGGAGFGTGQGQGDNAADANRGTGGYAGGSSGGTTRTGQIDLSEAVQLEPETSWRIYQMMNKSESDVDARFEDNPLAPYALPAVLVMLVVAGVQRYSQFRWRMRHG